MDKKPNYLSQNLLPPRVHISKKLEAEAEPELKLKILIWDVDNPTGVLTTGPNAPPPILELY